MSFYIWSYSGSLNLKVTFVSSFCRFVVVLCLFCDFPIKYMLLQKTGFEKASSIRKVSYHQTKATRVRAGHPNDIKWAHINSKHASLSFPTKMKVVLICIILMLACHELANANALAPPPVDCPRGHTWCRLVFGCCLQGQCRPYSNNV